MRSDQTLSGDEVGFVQVNYILTDIYALSLASLGKSFNRLLKLLGVVGALIFAFLWIDSGDITEAITTTLIGVSFGGLAAVIIQLICPYFAYRKGRASGDFTNNQFSFSDEGVHWIGTSGHGTQNWSAIDRVVATPGRLFIFIRPKAAFILPQRSFANSDVFAEWVAIARRSVAAAKSVTVE